MSVAPLSKTGARQLADAEEKIERGLSTFMEVGAALALIRDGRLYREQHESFETYCRDRWGFTGRRANQLMDAAEIGTIVPIENEGQARALAGLDPAEATEVYEETKAAGPVTAKAITATRETRKPKDTHSGSNQSGGEAPDADTGEIVSAQSEEGGKPLAAGSGVGADVAPGRTRETSAPSSSVPCDALMAELSRHRAEVTKWLELDHGAVIDAMHDGESADYRTFLLAVFNHASTGIDLLDRGAQKQAS